MAYTPGKRQETLELEMGESVCVLVIRKHIIKSHWNITTQTFIAYTPGQTSIIYDKIVCICMESIFSRWKNIFAIFII